MIQRTGWTLDESVSYALMVVLETLSPAERTTWVLHDLFGMRFAEVADIVGRSTAGASSPLGPGVTSPTARHGWR